MSSDTDSDDGFLTGAIAKAKLKKSTVMIHKGGNPRLSNEASIDDDEEGFGLNPKSHHKKRSLKQKNKSDQNEKLKDFGIIVASDEESDVELEQYGINNVKKNNEELTGDEDELNITPPGSTSEGITPEPPTGKRKKMVVRGGKRTKKTDAAIAKLKNLEYLQERNFASSQSSCRISPELQSPHISDADSNIITIKFEWKGEIIRMKIIKDDRLGIAFDKLSNEISVEVVSLSFTFEEIRLRRDDTVEGLGLGITSVIRVEKLLNPSKAEENETNLITLNLRTKDKKDKNSLSIRPTDKMKVLMEKYAEETGKQLSNLKFIFDGDKLDPMETPESLELEGGECIDIF